MFKTASFIRINGDLPYSADALAMDCEPLQFVPTNGTQQISFGWVPPRDKEGALVEAIGGHWIAKLLIERRKVPADVLARHVDTLVAKIEDETGRKPGRKAVRELKDQALMELLPQAFPKRSSVMVWIDPKAKLIALDSTSSVPVDAALHALVQAAPTMNLSLLATNQSPAWLMTNWLTGADTGYFDIGDEGRLKSAEDATVRYQNRAMDRDDVTERLHEGMLPTALGLTYAGRVSFVLTDALALKKIAVLDVATDESEAKGDGAADHFDADVAIITAELSALIAALIEALGGVAELPIEAGARQAEAAEKVAA